MPNRSADMTGRFLWYTVAATLAGARLLYGRSDGGFAVFREACQPHRWPGNRREPHRHGRVADCPPGSISRPPVVMEILRGEFDAKSLTGRVFIGAYGSLK